MFPEDQSRWKGSVDSWLSQTSLFSGVVVNPAAGVPLIGSGAMPAGFYDVMACVTGSVTTNYCYLGHFAAGPGALLNVWHLSAVANDTDRLYVNNWKLAVNEWLMIVTGVAFVGSFIASISCMRRA